MVCCSQSANYLDAPTIGNYSQKNSMPLLPAFNGAQITRQTNVWNLSKNGIPKCFGTNAIQERCVGAPVERSKMAKFGDKKV